MNIRSTLIPVFSALLAASCGDATGLDVEDLAGTWQAESYTFSDQSGAAASVELIATQGAAYTLTVTADGTASTIFNDGVGGSSSDSGTMSSDGRTLTLAGDVFVASRSGNTLTLVDSDEEYDFGGDGSDDPATLTIVLQR
jgi:hypothetical protein